MRIKNTYQFWAILLIIFGLLIGLTYISLLYFDDTFNFQNSIDLTKSGVFGDFIGGIVGSLWTLAGVFLFFQALKDQRKDLETNIKLLQIQIEELDSSRKSSREQSKILKIQQFETTFFSLLKLLIDISASLEYSIINKKLNINKIYKGKNIFSFIVDKLILATKIEIEKGIDIGIWKEIYSYREYDKIYSEMVEILQPYFGMFYRILHFIDTSELDISENYKYSNILRSYIINTELLVIRYHWARSYSSSEFVELLKKYNILKYLPYHIRPELMIHEIKLKEFNENVSVPVDLECISSVFQYLILNAFYGAKKEVSQSLDVLSSIFLNVKIDENIVEVKLEIPTNKFLNSIYKENIDNYSYLNVVEKLRNYDCCKLIEELGYAKFVTDSFVILKHIDTSLLYNLEKQELYDSNEDFKIFICLFNFKDISKLWIPFDLDIIKKTSDKS